MPAALAHLELSDDAGNTHVIAVRMRDAYQWEQRFRGRSIGQLNDQANLKLTYLYELAFIIAQRSGLPASDNMDNFTNTYDIAEVIPEETPVDPTQSAASPGESSVSLSPPVSPSSTGQDGSTAMSR